MNRFRASVPLTEHWEHFDFAIDGPVATVTLNRPEKLNPLTFESYADLRDLLAELPHHEGVRVLVIQGEGKGFCGGGDVNEIIGELIKMKAGDLMRFTKMTGDVIRAMRECPIPIITKIQGIAAGAGSVIALASDFRVVGRKGRFAFLFTKVGPLRRRHGCGVPPAPRGRARPGDLVADARRHHRRRDRRSLRTGLAAGRRRRTG